jgi:orotidine-5'-phosphate decarboxylase
MTNESLIVTIKNVYGKDMVYPANSVAQIFADIARQTTLSSTVLKQAQALGYKIEIQQQTLEIA